MTVSLDSDTSLLPGYYRGSLGELRTLPWPTDPVKKRLLMENSLGPRIIDWAEWRTDEPGLINDEGERWRFTDGQARFLILWYAFDEHGRFIYRRGAKRGSKGPIVHSTPVMTPDGWTTHGELKVGSKVFAEDGSVTTVTDLRPEVLEPTYRVKFRDGSYVDCTGSHRWPVEVFLGRGKRVREIKTVDEMLADGLKFKRKSCASSKCNTGDVSRFKALPSPLVDGVHVDMPVHPYVIGYWLGDGDKDSPRIVSDWDDMQHLVSEMDRLGVEHSDLYHTHGNTYRVGFGKGVASAWLRESGMLGNKHIPQWLLRASSEQRWALLQGLVDSDGHVAKNGQVEISLLDNQLADDVFELAVSLGLMPTFTTGKTSFNGKAYGDRKRIRFTPMDGEVVSRLPRKFERTVRKRKHAVPFSRSRTIVDIERIESQPARCITVEHESHVYLVGERNVPTCNTGKDPFGAAICNIQFMGPSQIYFDKALGKYRGKRHEMPLVQIASNSETQSMDMLRVANSQWGREASAYYGLDKGLKSTTVKDSAARMEVLTASERSAEGDPATFIALNETHHMTKESGGHNTAAVARRNVGKSKRALQARMLDFTNAHVQGMDSVGERTYAAWQKQQSKHNSHLKQDILYDSIEADPRLDPYVKEERELAIRQAYSDAPWADLERLGDEILDPELTAADAIRFYLNGLAVAEDAFIEPANFTALADQSKMFEPGDRIAMFLDCSKSEDATALMGCRIDDGFCQTLGVWSRPRGPRGEGFLVDRDEVDHRVQECLETYKVVWFGVDPSPAKDDSTEASYWKPLIDQWHLQLRRKLKVWATPGAKGHAVMFDMRLSAPGGHERNRLFSTETEIIQELIDVQGLDGYFRHDGDPILVEHMNNARCRFGKFGLNMHKVTRDSTQLVDAAVAMVGACVGRRQALNSGRVRAAQKKKSSGNGPRMMIMK